MLDPQEHLPDGKQEVCNDCKMNEVTASGFVLVGFVVLGLIIYLTLAIG